MKCEHCEKPATFHITELTGPEPQEVHLCEDHAKEYLVAAEDVEEPAPTLAGLLAKQFPIGDAAEELARLDQRSCPVCGVTFYEFRQAGRLGCPHDYVCFEKELLPLIENIHGDSRHLGKKPKGGIEGTDKRTDLIRLRREMQDAVEIEDYEKASNLRDEIQRAEEGGAP